MTDLMRFLISVPTPSPEDVDLQEFEDELRKTLQQVSSHYDGTCDDYQEPQEVERDAYGNPYNPAPVSHDREKDHYGNLYDPTRRGSSSQKDHYGNPYDPSAIPKRDKSVRRDAYGNPYDPTPKASVVVRESRDNVTRSNVVRDLTTVDAKTVDNERE